jgi:rSAM/selenodomain-associated transferase 1
MAQFIPGPPDPRHPETGNLLGVFAKFPVPGRVKTRLALETSPSFAAEVAQAFLCDLVNRIVQFPFSCSTSIVLALEPPGVQEALARLIGRSFCTVDQVSGNLGRRMRCFLEDQLQSAERVVLIGTDSPTLPLEFVDQAFRELKQVDIVLGPATDGGYYLVGCGRRVPPIFDQIPWGTSHVLAETVARLAGSKWQLALLPPWYDVDTLDGWHFLRGHLAALRESGVDSGLPEIEKLIGRSLGDGRRESANSTSTDSA